MGGRVVAGLAVAVTLVVAVPAHGAKPFPHAGEFVLGSIPQEQLTLPDYRRMSRSGLDSVRIAISWPDVQPTPFGFEWTAIDSLVGVAALGKVTILPYLYATPAWVAHFEGHQCPVGGCVTYAPSTSGPRAAFARFASEAVRRYGPGGQLWSRYPFLPYRPIRVWQIWSEPNSPKYYSPAPDAAAYSRLVSDSARAIRGVDPGARVLLGGMWGPRGADSVVPVVDFLRGVYRQPGAAASFDGVALHPYGRNVGGMLDQIAEARRVMRRFGDRRGGIWITEVGWASRGPRGHRLVRGRRGQAKVLEHAVNALAERRRRWRLRGAYWYSWTDSRPGAEFICKWCPGSGLHTAHGRPKPAWRAMKRVARRYSMPK